MAPTSPTVARLELSIRLGHHRKRLGLPASTVAARLGFTPNYLSAVENSRTLLAADKLDILLDVLEVDEKEREELIGLRERALEKGWWHAYAGLVSDGHLNYYGLEDGAAAIRCYEGLVLPGLLQTADYTRSLAEADPAISDIVADQYVELRLRRQERLRAADPLHLTALVSEAALLQQPGGSEVQRRQLEHLASTLDELAATVQLRVVPFTANSSELLGSSSLVLVEFADPALPLLARLDSFGHGRTADKPEEVRYLSLVYARGLDVSLTPADSRALVAEHLARLRS